MNVSCRRARPPRCGPHSGIIAALAGLGLAACADGVDGPAASSLVDAAPPADAAMPPDAVPPPDAASPPDARAPDVGPAPDARPAPDAAPAPDAQTP